MFSFFSRKYFDTTEGKAILERLRANDKTLVELDLTEKKLYDEDIQTLAEVLKVNDTLISLTIVNSHLGDEGSRVLAEALKVNHTLMALVLGNNGLGDKGAQVLAEVLKVNHTLMLLALGNNGLGDKGAQALAEALKVNRTLMILILINNNLGDEGAKVLAEALKVNQTLHSISLGSNGIKAEGVKALTKALKINHALHVLKLEGNTLEANEEKVIQAFIQRNRILTTKFYTAIQYQKYEEAQCLIQQGVNLVCPPYYENSRSLYEHEYRDLMPIEYAVEKGNIGIVALLINEMQQRNIPIILRNHAGTLTSWKLLKAGIGTLILNNNVNNNVISDNNNINTAPAITTSTNEAFLALKEQHEALAQEKSQLQQQLKTEQQKQQTELNALNDQNQLLKKNFHDLQEENKKLLERLQTASIGITAKKLKETELQLDKSKQELNASKQQLQDQADLIKLLQAQLEQVQTTIQEKNKLIENLEHEVQQARHTFSEQTEIQQLNLEQARTQLDQEREQHQQIWQQQQKTIQTIEQSLQQEKDSLLKRQQTVQQEYQNLLQQKQVLAEEKIANQTLRTQLEQQLAAQTQPDLDLQNKLKELTEKEAELLEKEKILLDRTNLLEQQQQANEKLKQELEQRAQELQQDDQRFNDLTIQYELLKQKLAQAEVYQKRVIELEDQVTQKERELENLRQQNASSLQQKITEQQERLNELQQVLLETKQQAEQAKQEALTFKTQLDKNATKASQTSATKNPYFGKAQAEWSAAHQHQHDAFKKALAKIKQHYAKPDKNLSCFVSYAWGNDNFDNYEKEVQLLVDYLRMAGFTVPFDRDNLPGQEPTHKFIQNIAVVNFVVICGTKLMLEKYNWKAKSKHDRQPVVKSELDLIEMLITKNEFERQRMRPVVFEGTVDESLPYLLRTHVYYHFQYTNYFEIIFGLIQSMYGISNQDNAFLDIKREFWQQANMSPDKQTNLNSDPALANENVHLKQTIEALNARIKALETELGLRTQQKEQAAIKIQSVFRGQFFRKHTLSELNAKRQKFVKDKITQLVNEDKFSEVKQLSKLANQGKWHEAMQMIRGKAARTYAITTSHQPEEDNNNNSAALSKTLSVTY